MPSNVPEPVPGLSEMIEDLTERERRENARRQRFAEERLHRKGYQEEIIAGIRQRRDASLRRIGQPGDGQPDPDAAQAADRKRARIEDRFWNREQRERAFWSQIDQGREALDETSRAQLRQRRHTVRGLAHAAMEADYRARQPDPDRVDKSGPRLPAWMLLGQNGPPPGTEPAKPRKPEGARTKQRPGLHTAPAKQNPGTAPAGRKQAESETFGERFARYRRNVFGGNEPGRQPSVASAARLRPQQKQALKQGPQQRHRPAHRPSLTMHGALNSRGAGPGQAIELKTMPSLPKPQPVHLRAQGAPKPQAKRMR